MRPPSPAQPPVDGPSRQCGECGYDLRGSGRSAQCPECGADLRSTDLAPIDTTDLAGDSGLDLVANSLFASIPALTGLILVGLIGRMAAVIAALLIGFRLAGLWRHRRREFRDSIPDWFIRLLWMTAGIEATIAAIALAMLILPLGLASPRAWWMVASGTWGLAAGIGIAAIAFGCGRIARRLGTDWAATAGAVAGVACLLAAIASTTLAALGIWVLLSPAAGTAPALPLIGALLVGPISALLGVTITRLLLLSIEAHAISTAIEAQTPPRDPLREIGVPVTRSTSSNAADADPLPLEPAKPPVRDDL